MGDGWEMDIEMALLVNFPSDEELNLSFKTQTQCSLWWMLIGAWKKLEKRDLENLSQSTHQHSMEWSEVF